MIRKALERTSVALLAAALLIPAVAAARPGCGHLGPCRGFGPWGAFGPGDGWARELMAAHLEVSDEQREQIRAVLESYRSEGEALRAEIWDLRRELAAVSRADELDEAAVRAAATRLAEREVELAVHRAKVTREVRNLLTAEQRARIDEFRERRRERGERMRHRFHERWLEEE